MPKKSNPRCRDCFPFLVTTPRCIVCSDDTTLKMRAYHKKYYQESREKIISYIIKFRRKNREHYKDYYYKLKLEKIDAVFEFFGYSVHSLNALEASSVSDCPAGPSEMSGAGFLQKEE